MRKVLSIVFSLTLVFGNAQEKVWVFFKDKPNVDNQILQPEKYLSSQSLERRASQNIDLHPTDFPVESSYLNEIRNLNIPVVRSSKWLNASSVYVSSQIEIDLLEETTEDICQSGIKLGEVPNKQEVVLIKKRKTKQGFFERLFHFFSPK